MALKVGEHKSDIGGLISGTDQKASVAVKEVAKQIPRLDLSKKLTPSQSAFPVFVMCQPLFVDDKIKNNIWMNGQQTKIDKEVFMAEWYNLYEVMASSSVIYLLPPRKGLQDQTYVNCAVYLPHYKKEDTIVLSNFKAPGRAGEEIIAGNLFEKLGYKVAKPPYKFEGEPELKYLKDNVYLGGYGQRTEIGALRWIARLYEADIIEIEEPDPHLYHLDCSVFRLDSKNALICTDLVSDKAVRQIEQVVEVHDISKEDAHEGATNSIRIANVILNASNLKYMKKSDKDYQSELHKNTTMERICNRLGFEIIFLDVGEASKSGAALSCFCMHLNYRD